MSAATEKPLEERARRFAALYRGRGTGSEAARGAGYQGDPRTIAVTAHRLAKDPRVLAEIERVSAEAIRTRAGDVTDRDVKPSNLPKLRAQHAAFVAAWEECGNLGEAARRAGYAGGGAKLRARGQALSRRADIAEHLVAARRRIKANAIADRNELEELLTTIARNGGGDERTRDRIAAIRELAKIQGHGGAGRMIPQGSSPPDLIPQGSSGAAVIVWRGNGRGPAPEEA